MILTMKRRHIMSMNLQFFAGENPAGGSSGGGAEGGNAGSTSGQQVQTSGQSPAFDYEKLAEIISGKQSVTENTVLKNYFKEQGLSQEEMNSAITAFKTEKARNTPDAKALQTQLANTNKELLASKINEQATLQAMLLGLDAKAIPYVIKMADMSKAADTEGRISEDEVKKALEQVLKDIPALKGGTATVSGKDSTDTGGFQIGGAGAGQNKDNNQEDMLRNIFGIKK